MQPVPQALELGSRCVAPPRFQAPVRLRARPACLASQLPRYAPVGAIRLPPGNCTTPTRRALAPPRPAFSSDRNGNGSTSSFDAALRSEASRDEDSAAVQPPPQQHWRQQLQDQPRLDRQQLLQLGRQFVECWFTGIQRGSSAVQAEMSSILAPQVVLAADGVRQLADIEGLPALLEELERSHQEYYQSEHHSILFGASEGASEQCVYALVEGRYQDVGGLPGHPATFRKSHCYHILVLHVGAGGKIVRVDLRRQLTEEDKEELLTDPMHCYPAPFPTQHLVTLPKGTRGDDQVQQMRRAVERFWAAWATSTDSNSRRNRAATPSQQRATHDSPAASSSISSTATSSSSTAATTSGPAASSSSPAASTSSLDGPPPSPAQRQQQRQELQQQQERAFAELESDVLAPDYKLTDAYGIWPTLRAPAAAAPSQRYLDKRATLRTLALLQQHYTVKMKVLDVAPAEGDTLACFTRWRARLTRRKNSNAGPGADASPSSSGSGAPANGGGSAGVGAADAEASAAAAALAAGGVTLNSSRGGRSRSFLLEGYEVDLFDDDVKLRGCWLFKGPLDIEARLLLAAQRQAEEAEAAEAERTLRRQRRQQREQQLTELLAWMQSYQTQWDRQVAHVQSAIERQRRRLIEVGGKVGGGSRDGSGEVAEEARTAGASGSADGGGEGRGAADGAAMAAAGEAASARAPLSPAQAEEK